MYILKVILLFAVLYVNAYVVVIYADFQVRRISGCGGTHGFLKLFCPQLVCIVCVIANKDNNYYEVN